jgi:sulfate transport system permease protein
MVEQPLLRNPLIFFISMAAIITKRQKPNSYARPAYSSAREESTLARTILITICLAFIGLFLVIPLVSVFVEGFRKGAEVYFATFKDSAAAHAIKLTLLTSLISVPLNVIFGLSAAWAITKFDFKGKQILITLIDLPFAVSPVISGLVFILIFSSHGWAHPLLENSVAGLASSLPWVGASLAEWFTSQQAVLSTGFWAILYQEWSLKIVFALPGIVLATCFVTFPFVAREIIPLMQSQGNHEEQAAITLGASGWKTFWRITLPNIKWALFHGVVLSNARAMGEFGAVSVVSGHIRGQTNTIPLHIEILYNEYFFASSFAMASILTLLALASLVLRALIEQFSSQESA